MLDVPALIQGVTEFLPVSSSLHLEMWAKWKKIAWSKDHEVGLHIGTLIALCTYFLPRKRWPSFVTMCHVVVATIPAVCVGFYIKRSGLSIPSCMAYSTIIGGVGLWLAERIAQKQKPCGMSAGGALAIGFAQVLAFIPGASRMGTTITMARLLGVSVREALTFSWMLAIPTVGGAVALMLYDAWKTGEAMPIQVDQILCTALVGWCVMMLVSRYAHSRLLLGCAYYRIVLGVLLLLFVSL